MICSINFFIFYLVIFFIYIKMSKDSSARYYPKNKEKIQKKSREKYWSLSEKEKNKKWEYDGEQYKNLSKNKNKGYLSIEKYIMKCKKIRTCYKQRLTYFRNQSILNKKLQLHRPNIINIRIINYKKLVFKVNIKTLNWVSCLLTVNGSFK